MSNKKLTVLGFIAVVMLVLATFQSRILNGPASSLSGQTYLLQGLNTANIGSIAISGVDSDEQVRLQRTDSGFVVVNKDNYPAQTSQINDLINKCLEIKTTQLVTSDSSNHEDLEVTEEKADTVIKFFKGDSSLLTGVIVGKTRELGEGTYIRLVTSDEVYITTDSPWFQKTALNYIEQELMSLLRADIESVQVSTPEGEYALRVNEASTAVLEDIPEGKQAKVSECETVFSALTSLSCQDVKRDSGELKFENTYVCRLKNTTKFTLEIARDDDTAYIRCDAVYGDRVPVEPTGEESEEELKEMEEKLLAWEKAENYSKKHKGWIYQIPSYKADNLTKSLADLVEDIPEPQTDESRNDLNSIETFVPAAEDISSAVE